MKIRLFVLLILTSQFLIINSTRAQMFWNQSCSFAGNSGSYVSVPNSSSINLTGSFSLEAWMNPASLSGASKGVIAKGGTLGTSLRYGLRIRTTGKLELSTNGSTRLLSKSSIQTNKWTHVSVTYNSVTNDFKVYIDNVLDTSSNIAGAAPQSNTDSLFIGISGSSTPFSGQLDEIRIWDRELSSTEVEQNHRTSLGTSSGIYGGLVLSMTFQRQSNAAGVFTFADFSGKGNNGSGRNVAAKSQSFGPYHSISQNECAEFDGVDDYLVAKDTSTIDPSNELTVEAWIYPRSSNLMRVVTKKFGGTISYGLNYTEGTIQAILNQQSFSVNADVHPNRWVHIAYTYKASTNKLKFYVNGGLISNGFGSGASINTNSDSLYIGALPGSPFDFDGFIDEVRISNRVKSTNEIFNGVFKNLEKTSDPNLSSSDVAYNLDGLTLDNCENGGPELFFRNEARFRNSAVTAGIPRSPMNADNVSTFPNGYYVNSVTARIPATGTSGKIEPAVTSALNDVISDVNVFVNLSHNNSANIHITLISPTNDSLKLFQGNVTASADNNVSIIFDDQADSSISDGRFSSFCSRLKPLNNLNTKFSGQNSKGTWKLRIRDAATGDTGRFYSWGINFNNLQTRVYGLSLSAFIQGFYNPTVNKMNRSDTISIALRNTASPYLPVDSVTGVISDSGKILCPFTNPENGENYFIVVRHRNLIESWSNFVISFSNFNESYTFIPTNVYTWGFNSVLVNNIPLTYALYNGDVNQDESIDLSDIISAFNDANSFVSGYVVTDVTGDDFVDLSDITLIFNNANNFVSVVRP